MEVQGETRVILLNDELRGLFDRLRSNTTLQIVERQYESTIRCGTIYISYYTQLLWITLPKLEHNLYLK